MERREPFKNRADEREVAPLSLLETTLVQSGDKRALTPVNCLLYQTAHNQDHACIACKTYLVRLPNCERPSVGIPTIKIAFDPIVGGDTMGSQEEPTDGGSKGKLGDTKATEQEWCTKASQNGSSEPWRLLVSWRE